MFHWISLKLVVISNKIRLILGKILQQKRFPTLQSKPQKNNFDCGNKLFILGQGRAGTSFLTNLLSNLGIDAGLSQLPWYNHTRSGWEWNHEDILKGNPKSPYLIKNPHLTNHIDTLYQKYTIDCVIIPIRYSEDFIKSRQKNFNDYKTTAEQMELANGKLLSKLVYYNIPFIIICYPQIIKNVEYAHKKINEIMAIIGKEPVEIEKFKFEFNKLVFK